MEVTDVLGTDSKRNKRIQKAAIADPHPSILEDLQTQAEPY